MHPQAATWPVSACNEGSEPEEFWHALGGRQSYPSSRAPDAPPAFAPRLFYCSDASGEFTVEEVLNFTQDDLDQDDAFLLDCWSAVFVWVGRNANANERMRAVEVAQGYVGAQSLIDGRQAHAPICVVQDGAEPPPFTCHFVGWVEGEDGGIDTYERRLRLLNAQPASTSTTTQPLDVPPSSTHQAAVDPAIADSKRRLAAMVAATAPSPAMMANSNWGGLAHAPSGGAQGSSHTPASYLPPSRETPSHLAPAVAGSAPGELFSRPAYPRLPALEIAKAAAQRGLGAEAAAQDSARRRAAAAAAVNHALGVSSPAGFDNPQTHRYSLDEIDSARRDSLNPVCKELYLTDEDFQRLFGMEKREFYSMRLWRQRELKRKVGLF
jgi:hypothetical protein